MSIQEPRQQQQPGTALSSDEMATTTDPATTGGSLRPSWGSLVVYLGALGAVLFLLAPMFVLIAISFTAARFAQFPPEGFSLEWYRQIPDMPGFTASLWFSTQLAAIVTVLVVILGTLAAIGLTLGDLPGKQLVSALLLSPLVVPSIVLGIALLQMATLVGSDHTFVNLILGHVVITLPYMLRTTGASLEILDRDLIDSARVLGANSVQVFWRIILPLIRPGIASGAIFTFLVSFDNFTISLFLQDARHVPLPIRIFGYMEVVLDPTVMAISAFLIFVSIAILVISTRLIGGSRLKGGGLA